MPIHPPITSKQFSKKIFSGFEEIARSRKSIIIIIVFFSVIFSSCQTKPLGDNLETNDNLGSQPSSNEPSISPTGLVDQQSAQIYLKPVGELAEPNEKLYDNDNQDKTWQLVLAPINLSENISGISVRVSIVAPQSAIPLSTSPFTVSQPMLDQGWSVAINSSKQPSDGLWHADLALINSQFSGSLIPESTVLATLTVPATQSWSNGDFSIIIDKEVTKVVTRSAQEVLLSILNSQL